MDRVIESLSYSHCVFLIVFRIGNDYEINEIMRQIDSKLLAKSFPDLFGAKSADLNQSITEATAHVEIREEDVVSTTHHRFILMMDPIHD